MKKVQLTVVTLFICLFSIAQNTPLLSSWLQNASGLKGRHYTNGNYTPINDNDSANVQTVLYSSNWVYVRTKGIPSYVTGPFLDGNPSIATSQNGIFKFPRNPVQNTGTPTNTTPGNIGLFINGVALFDYRDGVSWKYSTNTIAGGPLGGMGDGIWNRDAVVAEKLGFDCSKGHPAMGNYHHHQNPSAFKLDLSVISTICNLYLSDGLYSIDSTKHSPLIGFAYDGFPIYGAYGYKNADGTGGIVRMKSSYSLRNITTRTTYANGNTVTAGPVVSVTYPLGYFREDYQYNATSSLTPDYLDEHNGRFCVTPEYPSGTYCYFATVDANWNSAYPYVVGPSFYGVKSAAKVASITEPVTIFTVVPITGLSFNGYSDKHKTILKWTTSMEINNSHFEIERSVDGIRFTKVSEKHAVGNSSNPNSYTYIDKNAPNTLCYYRLKLFKTDGRFSFSNVITVNGANQDHGIHVFPNPSADLIVIQADGLLEKDMQVTLATLNGAILLRKDFYQGSTICFLETTTVYDGSYILTITNGEDRQSHNIIIKR